MEVEIDISQNATGNAQNYFESSKKAKKKLKGAEEAVEKLKKKEDPERKKNSFEKKQPRKYQWYQKYRWFYTSQGNLAIGGRDAQTNEEIIKKHTDRNDIVFHTDIAGSPFFVLKIEKKSRNSEENNELMQEELQELADATASFSKAWGAGASFADVYYVNPDQVSKSARAGEYLTKGSFMIYGRKNLMKGNLKLYAEIVSMKGAQYICITPKKSSGSFLEITPGQEKSSDAAKKMLAYLSETGRTNIIIDEIQSAIPGSGIHIEFLKQPKRHI